MHHIKCSITPLRELAWLIIVQILWCFVLFFVHANARGNYT